MLLNNNEFVVFSVAVSTEGVTTQPPTTETVGLYSVWKLFEIVMQLTAEILI